MARVSADQRREQLTAAAFRVMARVGVAATSTRMITEEAGVPQSLFHYCFRSKDELFQQLTREVVGSMLGDALESAVEAATFEESVRRSLQQMWANATEQPERQLVLYELTTAMLREPNGALLAEDQYSQYFDHTQQLLVALADRAGATWSVPINVLSRMTTTMLDGTILGWLADRNTSEASESIDLFSRYLANLATVSPVS